MAGNEQVGTGYVLIKPKLDEKAESQLKDSGKKSGSGFGSAFQVAAGNLMSSAVQNLAAGAAAVFANAFSNYADYEQLVGGIDTLFKESSEIVQRNAAEAYRTAGLSANDYMEQVTSFSASLLQGLGGDTEAAAAYADMAIRDMSDNANKMGSDMQSITNAYQGFAKQNYTMLDNLKLGYGGTKTEMERLLADASKIAGVEFNIDNYNDVIEAIHVMQTEMGITGTTAQEATSTITGSVAQMKAAFQNLLTGLFDENADLGTLSEQLFESVGAVMDNVVPRIGALIYNIVMRIPDVVINALRNFPAKIEPVVAKIFGDEVGGKVMSVLNGVFGWVASLIEGAIPVVSTILQTIVDIVGAVFSQIDAIITGIQPLVSFVQGVFESIAYAITNPIETAKNIVGGIVDTIRSFFSFSISPPHIPLPHFSVSPSNWGISDLLRGIIPSLGIEWYAKGGIVDGATLIGAGEAGAEAVIPLNNMRYVRPFAQAVASEMGVGRANYITVNLDYEAGEDAMTLARDLARELGNLLGMEA